MAIRRSPDTVMNFNDNAVVDWADLDIDRFYEELGGGHFTESEVAILQRAYEIVFGPLVGEEAWEAAFNRREGVGNNPEEIVQDAPGALLGREEANVAAEIGPPSLLIIPPESERETPSPLPVRRGEHDVLDEVRVNLFEPRPVYPLFSPIRSTTSVVVQSGDDIDEGKCPEEEDKENIGVSLSTTTPMVI